MYNKPDSTKRCKECGATLKKGGLTNYCPKCRKARLHRNQKPLRRTAIQPRREPQPESEPKTHKRVRTSKRAMAKRQESIDKFQAFARQIWKDRTDDMGNVRCEITGTFLGTDYDPAKHGMCISHIISKGARPDLYYVPRNVKVVHPKVHYQWEFESRERFFERYPDAVWLKDRILELKAMNR